MVVKENNELALEPLSQLLVRLTEVLALASTKPDSQLLRLLRVEVTPEFEVSSGIVRTLELLSVGLNL